MIARLITMLAVLAITLVTTVVSTHAARIGMGMGSDHMAHAVEMMHSSDVANAACDTEQPCGSADAEKCKFVCTGFSAFLTSTGGQAGRAYGPVSHDLPSDAIHVSRAPGLNKRPPELHLL